MTELEQHLRSALAQVMEVDVQKISLTDTFAEQGVDSFIGLRFARKIQDLCGIEIELEWLFDHPTLRDLSLFLIQQSRNVEAKADSEN
jgi:acyl carrier protein